MIPEAGRRFGPYEIQTLLGGGGMGHVYKAWDARLHREVAIKLLHNEFAMPGMRERFLREARAASALNHPNICTVFDIGEQNGDPYLVMELLQGETLKDRIQRSTIQVEQVISITKDVADALGAAHAKGVVHRDVKPANIFLLDRGGGKLQAKVLDFGLAKFEGGPLGVRGRHLDLTTAGAAVGTLAYMSPEQARGESLDSRSDLFSLGVVMYEMATKQTPFHGATSALVFVKLLNHPPEPVRDWNDAVPRDLEKIILKLMAKERTARYQTAGELEQALADLTERPTGGKWLRKAMATVPLVRAQDPVARERRLAGRRAEPSMNAARQAGEVTAGGLEESGEAQVLRPLVQASDTSGREASGDGERSVETLLDRRLSRPPRDRYHPDPDEIFNLPSRRATDSRKVQDVSPESEVATTGPIPVEAVVGAASVFPEVTDMDRISGVREPDAVDPELLHLAAIKAESIAPDEDIFQRLTEEEAPARRTKARRGAWPWMGAGGGLLIAGLGIILFVNRGHIGTSLLGEHDTMVLTSVENRTGDATLDGTIAEGLEIALAQSPYLKMIGRSRYEAALRVNGEEDGVNAIRARAAAAKAGAKTYLYGSIVDGGVKDSRLHGEAPKYTFHLDLMSVASNDVLGSFEEQSASLQQIPNTIDRLADDVRTAAGEDADSINATHQGLIQEATGNLEALHRCAQGDASIAGGQVLEALGFYKQAAELDPHFIQAQLRLVSLFEGYRAEVAAGEAARRALAAADTASERTRTIAQYKYELDASGNYTRAAAVIRKLIATNPHDSEALLDLARVLQLQGKLTEALQTGQSAVEQGGGVGAHDAVAVSLIGLERYGGVGDKGQIGLLAGYLEGQRVSGSGWEYGLILDNSGRLEEGLVLWRREAAAMGKVKGLESGAGSFLGVGALDRALVGECGKALALTHEAMGEPRGMQATFDTGMAGALCGDRTAGRNAIDELQRVYPQGTGVNGYMVADLKAALALDANDPATALEELRPIRQYDLVSITPYLRGRAHVALHQTEIGIVDFQTVLSHRGMSLIEGSDVYPAAQIGVARAFALTGDLVNSAAAYRQFLALWRDADPSLALLAEARRGAAQVPPPR